MYSSGIPTNQMFNQWMITDNNDSWIVIGSDMYSNVIDVWMRSQLDYASEHGTLMTINVSE